MTAESTKPRDAPPSLATLEQWLVHRCSSPEQYQKIRTDSVNDRFRWTDWEASQPAIVKALLIHQLNDFQTFALYESFSMD
jgi:hypothetical protein